MASQPPPPAASVATPSSSNGDTEKKVAPVVVVPPSFVTEKKYVRLRPWADTTKSLDLSRSVMMDAGGKVQSWADHSGANQQWSLEATADAAVFWIQSRQSDMFLAVTPGAMSPGDSVHQDVRKQSQPWRFIHHEAWSTTHHGYYYVQNVTTGLYLHHTAPKGTPLKQGLKDTNQTWMILVP